MPRDRSLFWLLLIGLLIGGVLAAVVFIPGNVDSARQLIEVTPVMTGVTRIDFELPDLTGTIKNRQSWKDKIILLNFWASWCTPCIQEIPQFNLLYSESSKDFVIVGINVEESEKVVTNFTSRYAIKYPILLDKDGKITRKYNVRAFPTSYFLDKNGILQVQHFGALSANQILGNLKTLNVYP